MITEHLVEHPTALVDGDSSAPAPVARLIAELIAAGVEGLSLPRCLDCGREKPLARGVPGGKVCNGCCEAPSSGGDLFALRQGAASGRRSDPDGEPVCRACRRRTYIRPVERCAVCGVNRSYRTRKRVCSECRERPHTTCATCGQPAAIPAIGEQPQCSHCRLGSPEPCEGCGAPTISRTRQGRPQCQRCYQRPVGTCGRCGRVRTIVRLAVDGDPDLCAHLLDVGRRSRARGAGRCVLAAGSGAGGCCAVRARRSGRRNARTAVVRDARWRIGPKARSAARATRARSRPRASARSAGRRAG